MTAPVSTKVLASGLQCISVLLRLLAWVFRRLRGTRLLSALLRAARTRCVLFLARLLQLQRQPDPLHGLQRGISTRFPAHSGMQVGRYEKTLDGRRFTHVSFCHRVTTVKHRLSAVLWTKEILVLNLICGRYSKTRQRV